MSNEVLICTVTSHYGDVRATLTPASRDRDALMVRTGSGPTIEHAIGRAMGRPRLRFATARDEIDAEIFAFREHQFTLKTRGDELCTIGIR